MWAFCIFAYFVFFVFFFKQKTAYEMRISDWSSDVCSSDLDKWDHPLLCYETHQDFRRCRLRFRWRSSGVKALDAVHGPTLTIEGRDESGAARSWYVRLWNYAQGSGEDAVISLDRKSVVEGKSVSVRVDLGGRRIIKTK